ncbi:MAG: ABC transporter permease [Acidimicrobiales bacterium]
MGILRPIGIRLAIAIAMAIAASAMLFTAVEVLPGDAATTILGPNATPERAEALRTQLRLDEPAHERYGRWLAGVASGDLGESVISGRSAWETISTPLRNSAVLGIAAMAAMAIAAVALGVAAGHRPGSSLDRALTAGTSLAASVPDFVLGTLLVAVLASWLDLLPAVSLVGPGAAPWDEPAILLLPVATMTLVGGAYGARLVRAVVADASQSAHVESARLAGLAESRVLSRHLLPGVAGPIAQVLAAMVPFVVGGTIVVERLFGYPGLGSAFVAQLAARDVVVVEAIGLLLTAVVIVALFTADSIGVLTDPRRRAKRDRPRPT